MPGPRRVQVLLLGIAALVLVGAIGAITIVLINRRTEPAVAPAPLAELSKNAKPEAAKPASENVVDRAKTEDSVTPTVPKDVPRSTTTRNARPADDGRPRVWAISIGIDGYNDGSASIPDCRGAEFAAQTFGNWLQKEAAWDPDNVLLLSDRGEKNHGSPQEIARTLYPSLQNLKWAFTDWLTARIRPGDLVVVFFAGQGIALPPPAGSIPGTAGRGVLLPIDARAASADLTGFSLDQAINDIAKTGKNPVLCLLDTSLNGRGAPVKSPIAAAKPDHVGYLRTLSRWPGVSTWLAATDRPAGQSNIVGELSPFTRVLIDALGTRDEPYNLLAALSRLQRDPRTLKQGFKSVGNLSVDLTLWSSGLRLGQPRPPELLLQRGHALPVNEIVFQADSSLIATASNDSTVRVWRAADRTLLRVLDRHLGGVTALALSESGGFLASGDAKGAVQIWDFQKREYVLRERLPVHRGRIVDLAFIPGSNRLLSRDQTGLTWLTNYSDAESLPRRISDTSVGVSTATAFGPIGFVVSEPNGRILRYGRDGSPRPNPLEFPRDPGQPAPTQPAKNSTVSSDRMATDGTRLICSNREGRMLIWDETTSQILDQRKLGETVDYVAIRGTRLAIASRDQLQVFEIRDNKLQSPSSLKGSAPITRLVLSNNGKYLAARTSMSTLDVWAIDEGGAHTPISVQLEPGIASSVGISPDEKNLVIGANDGGLRFWNLSTAEPYAPVQSRRGQITSLSVSGDGRHLLQITNDGIAQLWDLFEGRELSVIPPPETPGLMLQERWGSGAITADGKSLVLSTAPVGDVIVIDRETAIGLNANQAAPTPFPRPVDSLNKNQRLRGAFNIVTLSTGPGRKLVAAATGSVVCVWDLLSGALIYTIGSNDDPIAVIRGLDFSTDAQSLATACADGTIKVWDLSKTNPDFPQQPLKLASFALEAEAVEATAVRFLAPADAKAPLRVISGTANGEIAIWEVGRKSPLRTILPGGPGPAVTCLMLTSDQKRLAASFRDKTLRHWRLAGFTQLGLIAPLPNHDETINTLVAWPGRSVIASGSDDTTIRLWNLEAQKLEGTLSAGEGSRDWVVFAPNGRFDCAVGAERQLTWLTNNEVLPIEVFGEQLRIQGLTDQLSKGKEVPIPTVTKVERPRLAIDPPALVKAETGDYQLSIKLSEKNIQDLRLYQNGIPIRDASEFELSPDGTSGTVKVKLLNGTNRFYAMGGMPGTIDGLSNEVELRYDEPDPPGQLHILALGVGDYKDLARKLKYARSDAEDLTQFLHQKGVQASKGLSFVLRDGEVVETEVLNRLKELRARVSRNPQDTVAVFLAGHTDMLAGRFCLLLPDFEFKSSRGLIDPKTVIEFKSIYRYVAALGCQNRLMIVDACRSGEILNDPRIKEIRQSLDSDAHRGKTSYILAARPGGLAGEADALKHGLLTYSLLKGMGAPGLSDAKFTDIFEKFPTADRDRNKLVTADELSWYADLTVPKLAQDVPLLVQRSGVSRPPSAKRPAANPKVTKVPTPPAPGAIPLVTIP